MMTESIYFLARKVTKYRATLHKRLHVHVPIPVYANAHDRLHIILSLKRMRLL